MICKSHIVHIIKKIYPKNCIFSKFLHALKVPIQTLKNCRTRQSQIFETPKKR